jgi:hypothetical protein
MRDVESRICEDLGIAPEWLASALSVAHTSYRKIPVKKRSGGTRILLQPAVETKMLGAWVNARILTALPVSRVATGFEPGTSIVSNAQAHAQSLFSVRIDLKDFFQSIRVADLFEVMRSNVARLPLWAMDADTQDLIAKVCFDAKGRLPMGYPTSPRIANLVMERLDQSLLGILETRKALLGNAVLTRYADDFTFSTDRRGACSVFARLLEDVLAKTTSPSLTINTTKTRFMSRRGGSTLVTGLRIKQDGRVGIHANYRDHVRMLLKLYAGGKLGGKECTRLSGHLAFVQHADPALFTKLSYKYFREIAALRSEHPTALVDATQEHPSLPKAA